MNVQGTPAPVIDASKPTHDLHEPQTARASHWPLRITLASFAAFMALSAIPGAIFVVPTIPRAWLRQGWITPFADPLLPALALGILCGGSAVIALISVLARPRLGALASVVAGMLMIGFELVEIVVVGFTPTQAPTNPVAWLQVVYLVVGSALVALGARLWKAETGSYHLASPFDAAQPVAL